MYTVFFWSIARLDRPWNHVGTKDPEKYVLPIQYILELHLNEPILKSVHIAELQK